MYRKSFSLGIPGGSNYLKKNFLLNQLVRLDLNKVCGQMPHVGAPQCREPVKVLRGEALVVAGDDLPHVVGGVAEKLLSALGAAPFCILCHPKLDWQRKSDEGVFE